MKGGGGQWWGKSGLTLQCRVKEHEQAVQGNTDTSAVVEHVWNKGHSVDWEDVEVLDMNMEWYKRCVVESWHLQSEQAAMKLKKDQGIMPQACRALQ